MQNVKLETGKCTICGGNIDEKWAEKNPGSKCAACLDGRLILVNAYCQDCVIYPKNSVLTNILKDLVKEGYLTQIEEEKYYIIYKATEKGKSEGKILTEKVEKKYLGKEPELQIQFKSL